MNRYLRPALLVLGLALCLPPPTAAGQQVDSKAWANVSTTGPPVAASAEAERAKLTVLDEIVRGVRPYPGLIGGAPYSSPAPAGRASFGTTRPLSGVELAAAQEHIRAKMMAARPSATPSARWLGPVRPLPPKPREVSTSVPLTGEALARSLEQERAKLAAPRRTPRGSGPPGVVLWSPPSREPSGAREATPAPTLNQEQRAKLDAARAARPPQDNH